MFAYIFKSKIGPLFLQEEAEKIVALRFKPDVDFLRQLAAQAGKPKLPGAEKDGCADMKRASAPEVTCAETLNLQADAAPPSPLLAEAARQLEGYFKRQLKDFSLPLNPLGTAFMQEVWRELRKIPYGESASYKDIAGRVGRPGAARAVGLANNKNPIAIIIPCHRVIGANGKLVGYAGGLDIKRRLLALEQNLLF